MQNLQSRLRHFANLMTKNSKVFISDFEVHTLSRAIQVVKQRTGLEDTDIALVSVGTFPIDRYADFLSPTYKKASWDAGVQGTVLGCTAYYVHSFEGWFDAPDRAVALVFPLLENSRKICMQDIESLSKDGVV